MVMVFSITVCLVLRHFVMMVSLQQTEGFVIDVDARISIAYFESGMEKFRIIIEKNGGINQTLVNQIPCMAFAGNFVWNDDWAQTSGSSATAEPVIENKGDYVTVRCFGMYTFHTLSIVTDITVSKTGLILISSSLRAERDEPTVVQTAWTAYFPVGMFANEKAYVNVEGTITEVTLPEVQTTGPLFTSQQVVYWVDFSRLMEGVTFINMAPGPNVWSGTTVQDERQYGGNEYIARHEHTSWGQGAMKRGDTRVSKVAFYLHGPGGYSENIGMISLVSNLARAKVEAENRLESYSKDDAKAFASQAINTVESGIEKLLRGNISGAEEDLNQANDLLKKAYDTEYAGRLPVELMAPVIILVIAVIVVVLMRRRSKK